MKNLIQKCLSFTLALTCAGVLSSCGSKSSAKPVVEVPTVKVPGKGPKSAGCTDESLKKLQAASNKAAVHQSNVQFALDYLGEKSKGTLTPDQVVVIQLMSAELAGELASAVVASTEASTDLILKTAQCALE